MREVNIHRNLVHRHVVRFRSFFEDDSNMYIILELCSKQVSLIENGRLSWQCSCICFLGINVLCMWSLKIYSYILMRCDMALTKVKVKATFFYDRSYSYAFVLKQIITKTNTEILFHYMGMMLSNFQPHTRVLPVGKGLNWLPFIISKHFLFRLMTRLLDDLTK